MSRYAEPMSRLIDELKKLPGVGTKSAQRFAFHLLRSSDEDAAALADAVRELKASLRLCSICNNVTDVDPCAYCTSPVRNQRLICVVEEPTSIASVERTRIRDCEHARDAVSKMPGVLYMSLGTMKLTDLSAELQNAIAKTNPGGITEPLVSSAGVELILRCDKAVPKQTVMVIPTKDQIEEQLYEEQMTVLARRFMRDLRREADVETR